MLPVNNNAAKFEDGMAVCLWIIRHFMHISQACRRPPGNRMV